MIPSPMPISVWTPTMAANTVATEAPPLPPIAYSTTNASEASTTESPAAMPAATVTEVLGRRQHPAQQPEDRVAAAGGDQGHVDDVETERA